MEKAAAEAAHAAIEAAEAARVQPFLIAISRDRREAAKLIEFNHNNRRASAFTLTSVVKMLISSDVNEEMRERTWV
jgi:hypothetical protein